MQRPPSDKAARAKAKKRRKRPGDIKDLLSSGRHRNYKPRRFQLQALLSFVDEIYSEKITYDEMDDRDGNPRRTLSTFL